MKNNPTRVVLLYQAAVLSETRPAASLVAFVQFQAASLKKTSMTPITISTKAIKAEHHDCGIKPFPQYLMPSTPGPFSLTPKGGFARAKGRKMVLKSLSLRERDASQG
jgi:hypothetical protein